MQINKIQRRFLFLIGCVLIFTGSIRAQTDDTNSRSITSTDFQTQRPKKGVKGGLNATTPKSTNTKRRKNIAVISNSKRRYNLVRKIPSKTATVKTTNKTDANKTVVTTKPANPKTLKVEELGVTFWRLRPKNEDDDDAPTFSVKVNDEIDRWTAERVSSATKFRKGDKVRFSIESPRTGYIYIINREYYTDGTTGKAMLIFPTLKTRAGGDNRVTAGIVIEIPGPEVQFPYFKVDPKKENYAGEEVLILILPQKLPGIEIGMKAQEISDETVRKWLEDWSSEVEIFDAEDGEGIAYTQPEAQAATSGSRALTQEEPLPQTIYRVKINADSPLVVPFQMQALP